MSPLSLPLKIGITCGALGILLTVIGIVRGTVPATPASMGMALLIGGGFWFLVSWAVATAAVDVETDVEHSEEDDTENGTENGTENSLKNNGENSRENSVAAAGTRQGVTAEQLAERAE